MARMLRSAQAAIFCFAALLLAASALSAQDAQSDSAAPSMLIRGGPQDWSNRHVIFTRNASNEDVIKLSDDPRFLHSILQHYLREHRNPIAQFGKSALYEPGSSRGWTQNNLSNPSPRSTEQDPPNFLNFRPTLPSRNKHSRVDWSVSLGPTAGMALGETPSVYTANYSSPSCTGDFAVYTINTTPSTGIPGQANLIALNNLYSNGAGTGFCSGTGPSFLFSYAIGSGGSPLSPVLSLDGTRVAWIENRTATDSYLHVTIWLANQGATALAPVVPAGTFTNGTCNPVPSSCDFALEYTNAIYPGCPTAYVAGNGHSDLFVDYTSNTGFISANNGLLYHIKNIFSSTVSPSVDFCIPVNSGFESAPSSAMSGPVYDRLLNEVFLTDSEKIYAFVVNASATTPNFAPASPASYTYGNSGSSYNYQTGPGPLLDVINGYLYVFSTYDANTKTSVTQVPVSLASGTSVALGPKTTNANHFLFYGAFDNNYYNNGPKSAASTLYSCGTDTTTTTAQDLFSISFNPATGIVNPTPAMSYNLNVNPPSGTAAGICSPLTEFFDGTNDRLFVGMGQPGASTGADVVTMWNINTQLTNTSGTGGTMPTPAATTTATYLGGTSGFAADNNASGTAQAENIYFSTEQVGSASTPVTGTGYNVNGIYTDGTHFPQTGGLDDDGNAYSHNLLGNSVTWNGTTFTYGPANAADAWQATTITLPAGQFATLNFLAASVNGNLTSQQFVLTYTDNSTQTFTQSVSDWFTPQNYPGEAFTLSNAYRDMYNGTKDNRTFYMYGYSFAINPNKTVKSLTLPAIAVAPDNVVVVLAVSLSSNCGGADYCAVKLTQSALQ